MSLELEVLDQLLGGDMPLGVLASLFPDEPHARRAIAAMVAAGELKLLDAGGMPLSSWQLRELEHGGDSWLTDTQHRLTITDAGTRRIAG